MPIVTKINTCTLNIQQKEPPQLLWDNGTSGNRLFEHGTIYQGSPVNVFRNKLIK